MSNDPLSNNIPQVGSSTTPGTTAQWNVSAFCPACGQHYLGVHSCPAQAQALISESKLRQIVSEQVSAVLYSHREYLIQCLREAIARDRDAQHRDYANRKLARERDEQERREEEE